MTTERQTPESQRTLCWPPYDPDDFTEAADDAKDAAFSLEGFFAGREYLRKDPDGSLVCGYYPAYWRSKAKQWLAAAQ